MERGDLSSWDDTRSVIVLEGVLAQVPPGSVTIVQGQPRRRRFRRHEDEPVVDAHQWLWSTHSLKFLNDQARRYNAVFDVVTFTSPACADAAADYLNQYEIRVANCEYSEFDIFCNSLSWRPNVQRVIDSDRNRLSRYGIKAYQTMPGGEF